MQERLTRYVYRSLLALSLGIAAAVGCQDTEPPDGEDVGEAASALNLANHVSFDLEGCRNNGTITLPNGSGQFICPDPAYTSGNLGKGWNELDLVPYRIFASAGGSAPATQTYTVAVAVDAQKAGKVGYDFVSVPVLNTALSSPSCSAPVVSGPLHMAPGLGGVDDTLYRLVTITQARNTTCVYDYYAELAIGSHLYSGSSLHGNLAQPVLLANGDQNDSLITTSGIGAQDISIPVKEILPQVLSKTMAATQDSDHQWNLTKSPTPATLSFPDTCNPAAPQDQGVDITVTWTKLPATLSGVINVVTNIYATNPAARSLTVTATDDIRSGTTSLGTTTCAPVLVTANTANQLLCTHTITVPEGTSNLNDIATATYANPLTGDPIPGTTQATASATVQPSGVSKDNSAIISDEETITGNFLKFLVDSFSGASGHFTNYTAGTETVGPVDWTSDTQNDTGSVTFHKRVRVTQASITSGTLSDTAHLLGSDGFTTDASLGVNVSTNAHVTLNIHKTIPNVLSGGEQVTFTFAVKDSGGNEVVTPRPTITFSSGQTDKVLPVTGLAPGSYTVSEISADPATGWQLQPDQPVTITLPSCSGQVTFNNTFGKAHAQAVKVTQPSGSEAGWTVTLHKPDGTTLDAVTGANGSVQFPTDLDEGAYSITETLQQGWTQVSAVGCSFTVNYPADADTLFTCTFTNRLPAHAQAVKVTQPSGSEAGWTVTLHKPDGSTLDAVTGANGSVQFPFDLVAGDYSITETLQSGWIQVSAVNCNFTVSYPANAGQTYTCTFTNRLPAHATAVKVTQPSGSEAGWTVTLHKPDGTTLDAVTGPNGSVQFPFDLVAGAYSITETLQSGWTQVSAVGCSFTVVYPDNAGQTFTCTFTNRQPAHATAVKVTQPPGSEAGWTVTLHKPDGTTLDAVTGANGSVQFPFDLVAGAYSITETLKSGWTQVSAVGCSFTVVYPDNAGQTFTCTFTNQAPTTTGRFLPTATTCTDFTSGSTSDLLQAQYKTRGTTINNVSPGVGFYYSKVTAVSSSFVIDVRQTENHPTFNGLFSPQNTSNIRIFNANCSSISSPTTATFSIPSAGQARISVTGATVGAIYIVSVKYDLTSVVGLTAPTNPTTVHYSFDTLRDGTVVDSAPLGLDLVLKP